MNIYLNIMYEILFVNKTNYKNKESYVIIIIIIIIRAGIEQSV
jgi:hypothetical protein